MKLRRVAISIAATTALALGGAATAFADAHTTTINLHEPHVGSTAEGFQQDCQDDKFAERGEDEDAWHFVLPGQGSFESLTLTFSTLDGNVVATITSKDAENPSTGDGWRGYIDPAGKSGSDKHAYVFTAAGWTLTGGTAEVVDSDEERFNLSHVCPGVPDDEGENGNGEGENGNGEGENGNGEGENGNGETPAPVPTEVPAGYGTGSGVAGTVGLLAAFAAALAAGALLIRRRLLNEN
jgi:hypothetical protein